MRVGKDGRFHLAYCTKIHPVNGWDELVETLRSSLPALKSRLSPAHPFGIALRLSAAESVELQEPSRLRDFKEFLKQHDSYVFTMNGFPFGSFYGQPVKERIFAPDWRDEERVQYTLRLIEILRQLLPADVEGGISTLPLSYKFWIAPDQEEKAMEHIVRNLLRIVEALVAVRKEHGVSLHLDIEPEPDGAVENIPEFIHFYRQWLDSFGAPLLARSLQTSVSAARRHLRDHIQLCLDTCHLAVAYEEPAEVIKLLAQEGIAIGKVQIASGLKVSFPEIGEDRCGLSSCLERFAHSLYLHQVIGRRAGVMSGRYLDLYRALPRLEACRDEEWRIHYHMPLFVERYHMLQTTWAETRQALHLLVGRGLTRHLEIETYTWEQLPADLKIPLQDSLDKEYHWVLETLAEGPRT